MGNCVFRAVVVCVVCASITHITSAQNHYMSPGTVTLACPVPANTNILDPQIVNSGTGGDPNCTNNISTQNYQHNVDIVTTFTNTAGNCFSLTFPLSAMGMCLNDTVWFYDGPTTASPLMNLVWGSNTGFCTNSFANPTGTFTTTGTSFTLRFKSDNLNSARGLRIQPSCVTCPSAPANNECAAATLLTPGSTCVYTSGTTYLATQSLAGCTGNANDDVWYRFTANNTTQTITVAPTNASMDPVIQLYSGSCTGLTSLYCHNAGGVNVTETLNATGLTIGATYYIRVYDFSGNANTNNYSFNICVVGTSPQDCSGAAQVCTTSPITATNNGVGTQEFGTVNMGCMVSGEHSSAWYWFTAATGGTLEFSIASANGSFQDCDFALWQPTNCSNRCGTLGAPIRCSYSIAIANPGFGLPSYSTGASLFETASNTSESASPSGTVSGYVNAVTMVAGQCYVLLVDVFSGYATYTITWTLSGGATFQSCVLPIELLSFSAEHDNKVNIVRWATATEFNNDHFVLERSADAETFTEVARVQGAGVSVSPVFYSWTDRYPLPGINYYRLKQVDKDGSYRYTGTVSVVVATQQLSPVVYPNPTAEGIFYVSLQVDEPTPFQLTVTDALGRVMQASDVVYQPGYDVEMVDLSAWPAGSYFLLLTDLRNSQVYTQQLVRF